MTHPDHIIRVKICGITRLADAHAAINAGAHALGFVFHPPSRRFIIPEKAKAIISALPPFVSAVGVFVNLPVPEVRAIAGLCGLHAIQLHGNESPEECYAYDRPVIKAFRLDPLEQHPALSRYKVSAVLMDAGAAGEWGGTGVPLDWELLKQRLASEPEAVRRRIVLAGGLAPHNVQRAVNLVEPYAVDVSTGVEVEPGIKDHQKIKEFMNAVCNRRNSDHVA
ncbi:MAG: phosphoribosylanthranilate isomerase [Desulfomonilaceae bacterium]